MPGDHIDAILPDPSLMKPIGKTLSGRCEHPEFSRAMLADIAKRDDNLNPHRLKARLAELRVKIGRSLIDPGTPLAIPSGESSELDLDGRDGLPGNFYGEGFTADFDRQ
jgi:hypothetical protein